MKNNRILMDFALISVLSMNAGLITAQHDPDHYKYRGVETCAGTCHNNEESGFQYDIWKKSAHSRSYAALGTNKALRIAKKAGIKENPQEILHCLGCHTTGAGLTSDYYLTTYRKEDGVTCEACHKLKTQMQTIIFKEEDCLQCHNNSVHKTGKFIYSKRFAHIAHPMPAKKTGN